MVGSSTVGAATVAVPIVIIVRVELGVLVIVILTVMLVVVIMPARNRLGTVVVCQDRHHFRVHVWAVVNGDGNVSLNP